MKKVKFCGVIISGKPVTVQDAKKAGIIRNNEQICPRCGSDDVAYSYCRRCDFDFDNPNE